jgi:hypothetical protein
MLLGTGTSVGGVHRSTDGGTTWVFSGTGLPTSGNVRALAVSGTNVLAGMSSSGVYRSTNNGTNWSVSNSGLTNTSVTALLVVGSNVFAGTNGGIFISANGGQTWTVSNSGLTSLNGLSLASSGSNIYVGTSAGGVFVSTNSGANWVASNTGLTGTTVRALVASGASVVAGTPIGIFASTNSAGNWTAANTGLFNTSIQSLILSGSDLMGGTNGNGAWRRPFVQLTDVREIDLSVPQSLALEQNYPNPFNPSTRIGFQILDFGFASLKVFDILGREVATLVNEQLKPGSYEATFDGSRLSSGIYFYRLQAGALTETRKLSLLR